MPDEGGQNGTAKATRHRSPNYPGISLKEAVERIRKLYRADGVAPSIRDAALKNMGFEKFTGDAGRALSALRSFGLIQEIDGRLKLTPRAIDIVAREDSDPKHKAAIADAALSPAIYKQLLRDYPQGLPSDTTLKSELIAGKGFNPKAVDEFVRDFRTTLQFSGLSDSKVLESEIEDEKNLEVPHVGDYVQWESQGVIQFEARQVREVAEGGQYLFVNGSETGIPVSEVTIVSEPKKESAQMPHVPVDTLPVKDERLPVMKRDTFSMDEGDAIIQWPALLSTESVQDLEDWLKIIVRKMRRTSGARAVSEGD